MVRAYLRRVSVLLAGLAISAAASGGAWAAKISLTSEVSKFTDGQAARKLMIGRIDGRGGPELATALEAALPAVKVGGRPYFTALAAPPGAGPAVQAARRLGADAALTGTISADTQEGLAETMGLQCVARNLNGSCSRTALVKRTCNRRVTRTTAVIQVVRATTGQVVFSRSKTVDRATGWCPGEVGRSSSELIADSLAPLARAIVQEIAPVTQKVQLPIKDDDKALPKEARNNLRAAARIASKTPEAACTAWRTLGASAPQSPAVNFNLGVCAELAGELPPALARYRAAAALLPPGHDDLAEAMVRIQAALDRQAELARAEQARRQAEAAEAAREARRVAEAERAAAAERRRAAERSTRQAAAASKKQAQLRTQYGAAADAISKGEVRKGMTPAQVVAAKGQPTRRQRIGADEQWYYPGQRVIFTGGRVSYIGS